MYVNEKTNGKTIFETLFSEEICCMVSVSIRAFKGENLEGGTRDYSILMHEVDLKDYIFRKKISVTFKELDGFIFKITDAYDNIYGRDLSEIGIDEFKKNLNKFKKVAHNKYGRLYELKNNSFKKLYYRVKNEAVIEN